jgi:hypothetical protein
MEFLHFFLFIGDIFVLLDPDPDPHSQCGSTTLAENKIDEI